MKYEIKYALLADEGVLKLKKSENKQALKHTDITMINRSHLSNFSPSSLPAVLIPLFLK